MQCSEYSIEREVAGRARPYSRSEDSRRYERLNYHNRARRLDRGFRALLRTIRTSFWTRIRFVRFALILFRYEANGRV
jgi:hypothetical protein